MKTSDETVEMLVLNAEPVARRAVAAALERVGYSGGHFAIFAMQGGERSQWSAIVARITEHLRGKRELVASGVESRGVAALEAEIANELVFRALSFVREYAAT